MAESKQIEIHLSYGTFEDTTLVKDSSVCMFSTTRKHLKDLTQFKILNEADSGIYILLSNKKEIYVGQSKTLVARFGQHDKNELFPWSQVIGFISNTRTPFNSEMLDGLEDFFINKAKASGWKCRNLKRGEKTTLDLIITDAIKKISDDVLFLLPIAGYNLFNKTIHEDQHLRDMLREGTRKKSEAISFIKSRNGILANEIAYASNAKTPDFFAVDVKTNVISSKNWTLILNDTIHSKLLVFSIPAFSVPLKMGGRSSGVYVRTDTQNACIRIDAKSLMIKGTNVIIKPFCTLSLDY